MMSKVFVNIIVAATGKVIELKVSPKIKIGQLTTMVITYLENEPTNELIANNSLRLCDGLKGTIYSLNNSLTELDINDGHEMLLI